MIYRIKVDGEELYVKAVTFGGQPFLQFIPTFDVLDSAWYEEEKAKKYCEELNKTEEYKKIGFKFTLEEVKRGE